jgi:DNA polymerase-1
MLGEQIPLAGAIEILGPLLADPSVLKILQNAKFDMMMLGARVFRCASPIDDTMLISYAQDAGRTATAWTNCRSCIWATRRSATTR